MSRDNVLPISDELIGALQQIENQSLDVAEGD
jgi:hypothetical protein